MNYCSTFHAGRTRQLKEPSRCRLILPGQHIWQTQPACRPLISYATQQLICNSIANSRQPQMLSELGSYCMSTGINPPTTFTTYTSNGSKLPS